MKKSILWCGLVAVTVIGGAIAFLAATTPKMKAAGSVRVPMTPERIARGRHIYENVAHCDGCHSPRDWSKMMAPPIEDGRGSGVEFPPELGFPGRIVAPNITPDPETGLGRWTDGEKMRAIREGVSRDGRPLFPLMPYQEYAHMSDEDVESLVAFLNAMKPIRSHLPITQLDFPVSLLIRFAPKPVTSRIPNPDKNDPVKYGQYLVALGECAGCHTPKERGENIAGKEFAGGEEFRIGGFLVRSANITPDEETGIGRWSEERFVSTVKSHSELTAQSAPAATQATFTLMPWMELSKLDETELKAMYAYLRTLKPVYNSVEKHPPVAN